jgi:hypothetical protein
VPLPERQLVNSWALFLASQRLNLVFSPFKKYAAVQASIHPLALSRRSSSVKCFKQERGKILPVKLH